MSDGPPKNDDEPAASDDPLRLVLHTMEEQLDDRVDAVSDAKPAREETTAELIQLEETLSSAQDKAKKLVTLRLKLGEEETAAQGGGPDESSEENTGEEQGRTRRRSGRSGAAEPDADSTSGAAPGAGPDPVP